MVLVITGRMTRRFVQRKLLLAGVGLRNTIIIGWSDKAFELCDMVLKYPALGYKVIGFVKVGAKSAVPFRMKEIDYKGIPILGTMKELSALIKMHAISEVLIGLDPPNENSLPISCVNVILLT